MKSNRRIGALRALPALLAVAAMCLRADIVTLTDGRTVEGDIVSETPTEIVIKAKAGKTTIKREEIQSIEKRKSDAVQLREAMDALEKSAKKDDAGEWMKMAQRAKQKNERIEAQHAFEKVLKLEPENETARTEMGFVKLNGKWVAKNDLKEPATKTPFDPTKAAPGTMTKEQMAKAAGVNGFAPEGEKPVNCPKCNGTGIWITLPCLNCSKSDKPGYKMLGDHYEMDQRCGGTGKIIGAYCEFCKRTGKVMMSHIAPADGGTKKPNSGMQWCPVCNGTGWEKFLECNQCKRSKWPGYLFLGDQVVLCTSCGGAAKKPALACGTCKQTGMVPLKTEPSK